MWDIPTDDLWCRDSGPTFVKNQKGELAIAHIRFNGWGDKQSHANDALVIKHLAERLGLPLFDTGLVGEQGGIEHDGAGTLLAHASCWANPNRNDLDEDEISQRLMRALGGKKMIWAPGIAGKDITDYHIDALARFVGPGKVLIQLGEVIDRSDPWSVSGHETLEILEMATDARGKKLEIARLPDPVNIRSRKRDFVASYVNYYVCNGAVIAAQFGDKAADGRAKELLQSLYPGRTVEMLNIDPIGEFGWWHPLCNATAAQGMKTMKKWLEANFKALQAMAAIVTMVAAVAALVGVKMQIDANARQQREQSARDIYREYLNLSISKPEFSNPDYCAIMGTANEGAYEDYVEYLLYTSEQLLAAMPDWEPTLSARLTPHKELLCGETDWDEVTPAVQAMIQRFKVRQCSKFVTACSQ